MGIFDWFRTPKASPKSDVENTRDSRNVETSETDNDHEEAYALEWRNRYLTARVIYLKGKIEEKGGSISLESPLKDAVAENERLASVVSELETWLGDMSGH